MRFRRLELRLTAMVGTVLFLVSGMLMAPPARAEEASPVTDAPESLTCEASIDARDLSGGVLHITVSSRGLTAGHWLWEVPVGPGATPGNARLTDASGAEATVTTDGTALAADVQAGDWTLSYDLTVAGSAVTSLVISPAECLFLPADRVAKLTCTPPDGWTALANLPSDSQNMDGFRLRTARFLLTPETPRTIAAVGAGPAQAAIVALGSETACSEEALAALNRAVEAFQTAVGPSLTQQASVYVFMPAGGSPTDLAGKALDALWAVTGLRAPDGLPSEAQTLIDGCVWPLLRDALLADTGCATDAEAARRTCEEWRAYNSAQLPLATALTAAPMASFYLVERELTGGPRDLLAAVNAVCRGDASAVGVDFVDRLAAALAADAAPDGVAASGLLLRLAGRSPDAVLMLPELPDDVLAAGDPDSDGDGLPDRIDPAPAERGIAIMVGGRAVRLDVAPLNLNGRIMVPLRFLAERLGLAVAWDPSGRVASVARPGYGAQFPIGTHYYVANGLTHYLDAPAIIEGGRTLVSLRYVAKALDVAVTWDGATRTVTVAPDQVYAEDAVQPVAGRTAYLTFDDGPDPVMTPKILDVLKTYQVKATFFVLGGVAAARGELLRQIIRAGNGLGNHSYSHTTSSKSEYFLYRSPDAYLAELEACDRVIAAATGLHPRASRPPGGSYPYVTEEFRRLLRANGYLTYDWDASAADSALPRPTIEGVLSNIMAGARGGARKRLIILMHDGGREHQSTLAALPAVIEYLRTCGYDFGLLSGAGTSPPVTP